MTDKEWQEEERKLDLVFAKMDEFNRRISELHEAYLKEHPKPIKELTPSQV